MQATAALRRTAAATAGAVALVLTAQTAALAGGGDAQVRVTSDCTSVAVSSTKDISNVVLAFADGATQKFDDLSGRTGTFRGTGGNAGEVVTTAWVKSGNNKSGDGSGYGQRFDLDTAGCDDDGYPQGGDASPDDDRDDEPETKDTTDERQDRDEPTTTSGSAPAVISVDGGCTAVRVSSSKDISNVVLAFVDGGTKKFDGLSGRTGTFTSPSGDVIETVWVKSGNNKSGDGSGYGERFDLATDGCDVEPEGEDPKDEDPRDDDPKDEDPRDEDPRDEDPRDEDPRDDDPRDEDPDDDTPDTEVLTTAEERTPPTDSGDTSAPADDAKVLGATDERTVTVAGAAEAQAPGLLPNTGADALAAALAALSALGIGLVLVRRGRTA